MSEFFDYDPVAGMTYYTDYDHDNDEIVVHSVQDVQPHLDWAKEVRNSNVADKGIKRDMWHYAIIPTHVQLELRQKGINIYKKDHWRAMLKEINTNYPHLKMTSLKHE